MFKAIIILAGWEWAVAIIFHYQFSADIWKSISQVPKVNIFKWFYLSDQHQNIHFPVMQKETETANPWTRMFNYITILWLPSLSQMNSLSITESIKLSALLSLYNRNWPSVKCIDVFFNNPIADVKSNEFQFNWFNTYKT